MVQGYLSLILSITAERQGEGREEEMKGGGMRKERGKGLYSLMFTLLQVLNCEITKEMGSIGSRSTYLYACNCILPGKRNMPPDTPSD